MSSLLTLNTGKYMSKLANENFVKQSKVNDKDTRKSSMSVFVVNFELISHFSEMLLFPTLNCSCQPSIIYWDHPSDSETVSFHNFKLQGICLKHLQKFENLKICYWKSSDFKSEEVKIRVVNQKIRKDHISSYFSIFGPNEEVLKAKFIFDFEQNTYKTLI